MKKTFNVIAVNGHSIYGLVGQLVGPKTFRRYMDPQYPTLEVDEEAKKVSYGKHIYDFVEYRFGVHGLATVVVFKVGDMLVEAYTDTPAFPGPTQENILTAIKRRKDDPGSGY